MYDLGEADDRGVAEQLGDRLLVVLDERLLEQHLVLEPAVEPALDDLRDRLLGLALGAGDALERGALLVDRRPGHLVAGEVPRLAERDVHGDVVGQLGVAAVELDEHAVDAAAVLLVQVGVERRGRRPTSTRTTRPTSMFSLSVTLRSSTASLSASTAPSPSASDRVGELVEHGEEAGRTWRRSRSRT